MKPFSFLSILLIFLSGGQYVYTPGSLPTAKKGMLDLTDWSFQEKGFVYLNGWEFYWNKLLSPSEEIDRESKIYLNQPKTWNKFKKKGKIYPAYGHATYRLKIKINKPGRYAVYVSEIDMAHKFWVDNILIGANGRIGTSAKSEKEQIINYIADFYLNRGVHTFLLQVSNYQFKDGGIRLPIHFGNYKQIQSYREIQIIIESLVFGFIGFMILTHFILFLLNRKDWSNLFFVILCICSFIYLYLRGARYLLGFFPDLEWDFYSKFLFAAAFSYGPVLFLFNHYLYPGLISKKICTIVKIAWGIFVLSVLIFSTSFFIKLLPIYEILIFPLFLYVLVKSHVAFKNQKKGSLVTLIGMVILIIGIIIEILFENQILPITVIVPSYLVFLFTQSILTSIKFTQAYKALEKSREEISLKNIELNRLSRLKDEFLSNTTHELKTPLHGIIGIADALNDGIAGELNQKVKSNLSIIINSAQRLSLLVNDILDAQRLKNNDIELNLTSFDLNQIVMVVVRVSQPLLKNKLIELKNHIPPGIFFVYADSNRLYQVLQNLVSNACKFTDSGTVEIFANEKDSMVSVCVSDTGNGIPKEYHTKIFDPFEQVKSISNPKAGTGLGLSITKKLVELHGGTIGVESASGMGSKFTFTIPSGSKPTQNKEIQLSKIVSFIDDNDIFSENIPDVQGQEILVVDDEAVSLKVVSDYLIMNDYKVHQCHSGEDAINYLKKNKPNLVLLDVMMPEIDGFSVCKKIRETYSQFEMPVIFLTAKNQLTDLVQGFSLGGNDYLTKPFSKHELLARVRCQIAISKAKDRLVNLREFANKICSFKNIDILAKEVFNYIVDDLSVDSAALFYDGKIVNCTHSDKQKFIETYNEWNLTDYHAYKDKSSFVFIRFTEIRNCVIIIKTKTVLTPVDIEYFRALEIQAGIIVKNFQKLISDKYFLDDLHIISNYKKYIRFIKKENKQTILYEDKNEETIYLKSSLKTIECFFAKDLIRANRFCLINPKKIMWIDKYPDKKNKTERYMVNVDGENIVFSKNHIDRLPVKQKMKFLKKLPN